MVEERLMKDNEFEELLQKSITVPKEGEVEIGRASCRERV